MTRYGLAHLCAAALATALIFNAASASAAAPAAPVADTRTAPSASPYRGEEARTLKALSARELDDYRNGRGMGLSKAAELNRYPGPRHVLELATPLALSPEQRARTEAIVARMHAQATRLGSAIIDEETALDQMFAQRRANASDVARIVKRIGALQAELRLVHLHAHIDTTALLTPAQIARYDVERGYAAGRDGATGGSAPAHRH